MKTYIALLRGINVSGQKLIKMEVLRSVLASLDFENITTYIQSGNIIFKSKPTDHKVLEEEISETIEKHFGFQVPVVIVTLEDLLSVVKNNPYSNNTEIDPTQPYVAFLSDIPSDENLANLDAVDFGNDEFTSSKKSIYLHYSNTAGNSKLNIAIIENRLKVKATSRNWKTILKLISLAEMHE